MRKIFTLACILCAATSAMAQSLEKKDVQGDMDNLNFVSKTFGGGKCYLTNADEDGNLNIYDPSNEFSKQTFNVGKYVSSSTQLQVGTAKVTGVKFKDEFSDYGYIEYYSESMEGIDASTITTSAELVSALNLNYGDNFISVIIPGTDYVAAANTYSEFYHSDIFGKKYPTQGYCIKDKQLYQFNIGSYKYQLTYDTSNTNWLNNSSLDTYTQSKLASFDFIDVDEGIDPDGEMDATTSVFNNDDNWEWIEIVPGDPVVTEYIYEEGSVDENMNVQVTKSIQTSYPVGCLKVKSSNGSDILTIPSNDDDIDIYKMNDKYYFLTESQTYDESGDCKFSYNLYEYIPGTSSGVKKVISDIPAKSKVYKTLTSKGITINAANGKQYTTGGQILK